VLRTSLPRYCNSLNGSSSSSSCFQASILMLFIQNLSVSRSSLITPGPQALQSTRLNVGFMVLSTTSDI
jgi:hypothetical protein